MPVSNKSDSSVSRSAAHLQGDVDKDAAAPSMRALIARAVDHLWKLDEAITPNAIFRQVNIWTPICLTTVKQEVHVMWEEDLLIRNFDDTYMNMPSRFLLNQPLEDGE